MPTSRPPTPPGSSIWAAMLVLYLVWGSTYLAVAIAVDTIPPFLMAGTRFLIAGFVLVGWSVARDRRAFEPPSRREWRDSSIVGALLVGAGMGLVAFGELTVPSGITALLIATMPVWVAILGRVLLGERLPRRAAVGIVIGFGGVAILVGPSAFGGAGALDPLGLAAIMLSPLAWAAGSMFASHGAILPRRPLVSTGLQMICGGLVLMVVAVLTGEFAAHHVAAISTGSVAALLYLTMVGSLVAFSTYGWLLRVAPLPLVSTYAYVNPVVAVILGAIVLGEIVDARTIVAGAVILFAVALIVTARGRMRAPQGAAASERPGEAEPAVSTPAAAPAPTV